MAKNARKRQKTRKSTPDEEVQPLGTAVPSTDDPDKDDEERQLESLLFGTPYVPSGKNRKSVLVLSDHEDNPPPEVDKELEHLTDADLFFVDDGKDPAHSKSALDDLDDPYHSDGASEGPSQSLANSDQNDEGDQSPIVVPPSRGKARKPPAWTDPDDAGLEVSLVFDKRRRKLRDSLLDDAVSGREYERRLRRQFQRINPAPEWVSTARQKLHPTAKRRRSSSSSASQSDPEDAVEGLADLLSSTAGILGTGKKGTILAQGTLRIERLRDANQSNRPDGLVKSVQFHPSPHVPVLLTANSDRRLSLFNIDGHTNPHLQTLHIPTLPLSNAVFHPTGSSVLLTGNRPFYYTYDLQSGTTQRSPRGLWGTTFNRSNPAAQDLSMATCAFSPTGDVLAVAGRRGYVHLVDWNSGAGQVVASLKMNAGIKSLWWPKGNPASEGRQLLTLGDNAEVYLWDVGERRCLRRWRDDGEFGSAIMSGDPAGKYLAIGARSGYVNVYDQTTASKSDKPRLLKAIGNLTTPISALRFNHDAQLLAIASNSKKDQMRLIHLPSLTAYANWPTSSTPLAHVTSMDFSTGSEYLAIGNNRGNVLLYHLQDFGIQ